MKKYIISLLCFTSFASAMNPKERWSFQEVKTALEASKTDPNSFLHNLPAELRNEIIKFPALFEIEFSIRSHVFDKYTDEEKRDAYLIFTENPYTLFNLGIDPNIYLPTDYLFTPLIIAIKQLYKYPSAEEKETFLKLIKFLLDTQANPNMTSLMKAHTSPLYYATHDMDSFPPRPVENIECIDLLVQYGAKVNSTDYWERTVLDFLSPEQENLIEQLRAHGAKTGAELKAEQEQQK